MRTFNKTHTMTPQEEERVALVVYPEEGGGAEGSESAWGNVIKGGLEFGGVGSADYGMPIDRKRLSVAQMTAIRGSILDPSVIAQMSDQEAVQLVRPESIFQQAMFFCLGVVAMGTMPIFEQLALYKDGKKQINYMTRMPFILSYLIGSIVALSIAALRFGMNKSMAQCFDWKEIALSLPSAVAYSFSDYASMRIQVDIDASLWKVLNQSRLMLCAIAGFALLGQRQSASQWILLVATTTCIVAYAGRGNFDIRDRMAFILGITSIFVVVLAGTLTEFLMKRKPQSSFVIQMFHSRISLLVVSIVSMCVETNNWGIFPFGNWHSGVTLLVITDIAKGWIAMIIIKRLNSVWKALAAGLSLGITYVLACTLLGQLGAPAFDIQQFTLLLAISLNILAYANTKREDKKFADIKSQVEQRTA